MEYTNLGTSGLKVSRIALGCMSFGAGGDVGGGWSLDEAAAEPIFRQAVDLGITFWDTANVYSSGSSEEITGRAIEKYTRREDVVLATKVFFPVGDGSGRPRPLAPGDHGADRRVADAGWAPTTSTSTRSTASTRTPRSRRRWRPCTTW